MLSAGRLKINELRNKVTELTVQLANVQSENKQLMRQQQKQVTCLCAICLLCTSPDVLSPTHYVVMQVFAQMVQSALSDSVLSVCNVGVLWPNDWMHQDATWYGGRPQPRPHCVRWASSSHHEKGHSSPAPTFRPTLLWHGLPFQHTPDILLWSPYVIGQTIIFLPCDFYLSFFFFLA